MNVSDLTPKVIEQALSKFYPVVSDHVQELVLLMSGLRFSIPKNQRRIGAASFEYFFAADLDRLFEFAIGRADVSASHIEGLCARILDVLHRAPAGRLTEDWELLGRQPVGAAILAARSRIRLRDENGELSGTDIAILSGVSPQKVAGAKMDRLRGKGAQAVYPAEEVRALFEREGIRI